MKKEITNHIADVGKMVSLASQAGIIND